MFAMLCSKPDATKSHIGKKTHTALLIPSFAPNDIHTARHTSQLHRTPITNACVNVSDTLPAAVLITDAPRRPPV